jgi:hypothetical protein
MKHQCTEQKVRSAPSQWKEKLGAKGKQCHMQQQKEQIQVEQEEQAFPCFLQPDIHYEI